MSVLGYSQIFKGATNSGGGAPTLLTFSTKQPSTTNPTSLTSNSVDTTGANLVVVVVCDYPNASPGAAGTLSDNKSNTFTLAVQRGSVAPRVSVYYIPASGTFGTGHTFTWSTGAVVCYPNMYIYAFSGAGSTPSVITNSNQVNSSATSLSTNSITTTSSGYVLLTTFTCLGNSFGTGTQPTISGGGFSNSDQSAWTNSVFLTNTYNASYLLTQGAAGSSNPTHSFFTTNSNGAAAIIAAFK